MDKIEHFFRYRNLDMILNILDYSVDSDDDVDISEFNIKIDYVSSESHPHPADEIIDMFKSMLNDGNHLKEIIMSAMSEDERELIKEKLRESWNEYWESRRS